MKDRRLDDPTWRERVGFDNIMTEEEVRLTEILAGHV